MKILFLSSWYPGRVNPYLGNFVQKHAEAVALKSDVAALFVCADATCKTNYEIETTIIKRVFTVNVYYKKVNHSIPLLSQCQRVWRYLRAHNKGWLVIKKKFGKVDIVHHNILYPAGIFALILKLRYSYPYIITENSTEYLISKQTRFGWMRKTINRIIARNASCITPVSEDLRKAMVHHGLKNEYRIVYNVVNTDLFVPDLNKHNKKYKLLHISTLNDEHKNISGMLRAILRLSQQRSDFECWIMGDGDVTPFVTMANESGIYNSVVFFDGSKTTKEVAEIMKSAACFFMFSNYENLPVVILEALSCGLPVLSSDVGGIAEHIKDYNGLLIPAGDENALLAAFNEMLNNIEAKKYDVQSIRNYAVRNFSYPEVCKKFHQVYSEVLNAV